MNSSPNILPAAEEIRPECRNGKTLQHGPAETKQRFDCSKCATIHCEVVRHACCKSHDVIKTQLKPEDVKCNWSVIAPYLQEWQPKQESNWLPCAVVLL